MFWLILRYSKVSKMHKHTFTSGAIRGQQCFRYCAGCKKVLFYYGTNRKPEERVDEDYEYYRRMAEQYAIN